MGWGNPEHRYRLWEKWMKSNPGDKDLRILVDVELDMTGLQPRKPTTSSATSKGVSRSREMLLPFYSALDPGLGSPAQQRCERTGFVQPGVEKIPERPHCSLPEPKGGYKRAGEVLFTRACSDGVRHWNREVVGSQSLQVFKARSDWALSDSIAVRLELDHLQGLFQTILWPASFVSLGSYLPGSLTKTGFPCLSAGQDSIDVAVKEQTEFCCLIHQWQWPANCCCQGLYCSWWSWRQWTAWDFLMDSDSCSWGTEKLHPSFVLQVM